MAVNLITTADQTDAVIDIHCLSDEEGGLDALSAQEKRWAQASGFEAKPGQTLLVPDADGQMAKVYFGRPSEATERGVFVFAKLVRALPDGTYQFTKQSDNKLMVLVGLLLEAYQFTRYKEPKGEKSIQLLVRDEEIVAEANRMAKATSLVRDLINTPTNDMGPQELSDATRSLAETYGATFSEIVGDDLLEQNFPLVHTVGRASDSPPRLLDMRWGRESDPKVTLVGKGVCFDTGGLNIKTGNFMMIMKKDMGGAANVLGLAMMIMDAELPVRLRVLIPAVENAIAGNAFRPGDILPSRLGLSVEIANTDAEGRLILADALAYGDEEEPDVMIDMATLTGAARVALGPDLPPFYTHDDAFADELMVRAKDMADPIWRMPLWQPYQAMLETPIADVNHAPSSGFAGSVTAALFLERFVTNAKIWSHFDVYGWTPSAQPAHPKGGEAQAIRALYKMFKTRFGAV